MSVWAVSLLGFLASGLGARGAQALGLTDRLMQQLKASSIAAGAVQHALGVLALDTSPSHDGLSESWANHPSRFSEQPMGEGTFSIYAGDVDPEKTAVPSVVGLMDEERKLNLNTAPSDVIQQLLRIAGGLEDADATMALAEAIEDWRDQDKEPRRHGAEDFYYLGLDPPYECKDAPVEQLEELLLVKGMSPALFARLAPYLTVWSSGSVNVNTADRTVLQALGVSDVGASGFTAYRAGEDAQEGTTDDRVLPSVSAISTELASWIPAEDVNRLVQLSSAGFLTVKSETFQFSVVAQTEKVKGRTHVTCVIDRAGQIKAWTER